MEGLEPLSIDKIAGFFDRIQEEYLEPFDWDPNEHLDKDRRHVFRIKELFRDYYEDRTCRYRANQENKCGIRFCMIFRQNILMVYQAHQELEKMKMISDYDAYDKVSSANTEGNSEHQGTDSGTATQSTEGTQDNKRGSMAGSVDMLQLDTMVDESRKVIETKNILSKSEDKMMDYMAPVLRDLSHNVDLNKNLELYKANNTSNNTSNLKKSNKVSIKSRQGIEALNQIRAHEAKVMSVYMRFIECFYILFY